MKGLRPSRLGKWVVIEHDGDYVAMPRERAIKTPFTFISAHRWQDTAKDAAVKLMRSKHDS